MGSLETEHRAHAVCVPYPAQGHIDPMLKLAKILHSRGNFHVTFVHTEFNLNRLIRSHGPAALEGPASFRFEAIPDGLPPTDNADATQDITSLCRSTELNCLDPFRRLLRHLNSSEEAGVPPVTCIVSDVAMSFMLDAAQELGVPEVMLWTASACGLLGFALVDELLQLGLVPFKDENFETNGDLDQVLDCVPAAMAGISLKYLPSFIRTTNPDDFLLHYVPRIIRTSKRASAVLINSFDALDHDVLQTLISSHNISPLYTIGPLQPLLEPIGNGSKSIGSSLWKEDPSCTSWLDSFAPGSVIYVNFGSITVMSNDQYVEFAWGLANSNHPFLWITRPDLVTGSDAVLPPEFSEKTRTQGKIASWCNQEQVLAHLAIGGFLTHCGWNSTLESICNGVPMICWPFFAEQQTNCWFCCRKWGVGMEMEEKNVERGNVERQVKELMEGDEGKKMREKAMELKRLAREAITPPNGSSWCNLDHVINKILLS